MSCWPNAFRTVFWGERLLFVLLTSNPTLHDILPDTTDAQWLCSFVNLRDACGVMKHRVSRQQLKLDIFRVTIFQLSVHVWLPFNFCDSS